MKILAVSLLRLGDVFLAAPAIAGIKRKYPDAEIHGLVNRQALGASQLINEIDQWHIFERDILQNALGDVSGPILEPFFRLDNLVQSLRAEEYDLVLNFTHNRLSGWLCGAIEARQTIGLALDGQGRPRFGSSWFQFLNDKAEDRGSETFHYADVFWFGAGQNREPRKWHWRTNDQSKNEAEAIALGRKNLIAIQPFTSESKKEWGQAQWCRLINLITTAQINSEFVILAAPDERERAEQLLQALKEQAVNVQLSVCSLMTAVEILSRSSMMITGDTSIKHLAAALPVKVIELSLGSSDWRRTGIYKSGAYIVQPKIGCAPCPHSVACTQSSHECAQILSPDVVADLSVAVMNQDNAMIETLARTSARHIDIFRTGFSGGGYWQCLPVGRNLEIKDLRQLLDKLTSKMLLQGEHLDALGSYGTEAYRLGEWLRQQYPQMNIEGWRSLIGGIEADNETYQFTASDALKRLQSMVAASKQSPMVELKEMRFLQSKVEDISRRLEIRRRLTRSLQNVVEDSL